MNDLSAIGSRATPVMEPSSARIGGGAGLSTRSYLIALSLVLMVPVLIVAGALAFGLNRLERERFELSGHEAARSGALAIDLEIRGLTRSLLALAASPALTQGDLAEFYNHASAAAAVEGAIIGLRDTASRQILNTAVPLGGALPEATRLAAADQEALRGSNPVVSDYFLGIVDNKPHIAVVVPVVRDGAITHLLSAGVPIERIRQVLVSQFQRPWRLGVIGRDGVVIARVTNPELHGQRPPAIGAASAKADSGYFELIADDGEPSAVAFRKTSAGWTVLGVASIGGKDAARRNAVWLLLAGSIGLITLGVGSALAIAQRISRPMRDLESAGERLSRGEPVGYRASPNLEANSVSRALSEASATIRAREAELNASRARYKNLFDTMDEGFFVVQLVRDEAGRARDYRFIDVNPAFERLTGLVNAAGRLRSELLPDEDMWWLEIYDRVVRTGESARFEYKLRIRERWFDIHATRLPDGLDQVAILSEDITERKRAEATRELLVNELNHRVKNTLSAVQSLAIQTFRGASTIEEGKDAFVQRLLALSRAHNVLTQEHWEGASVRDIVSEAAKPFDEEGGSRFTAEGPDLRLAPKAALALAMGLHELATNALKYGALTSDAGRIAIRWSLESDDMLRLEWRELGGPPIPLPRRRGFGTRLLTRSIEDDLGGSVQLDYARDGLVCGITLPLRSKG